MRSDEVALNLSSDTFASFLFKFGIIFRVKFDSFYYLCSKLFLKFADIA